jgi:TatD DNase family protein
MLFDTHAHIDQADFDPDRDEVISRAHAAGVAGIVAVGTTLATSRVCVDLASRYAGVHAAVAIHPNYVAQATPVDFEEIARLASAPRVVAIGETGLDRHWDFTPFNVQQVTFARHIGLAVGRDLPFIVHMRDCEPDILDALRAAHAEHGPLRGIMHSFTGDEATARACVEMGLHISFAGMVTFKNSEALRKVAATVPLDRLLVETDSPYLAPMPFRGKRNEPAYVAHTAACLAQLHGLAVEKLSEQTTQNARQLLRLM